MTSRDWFADEFSHPAPETVRPEDQAESLQAELNDLLGSLARVRPESSIGDDHQTLLEALKDRYVGR